LLLSSALSGQVFNSDGHPLRAYGPDIKNLRYARSAHIDNEKAVPWWIEASFRDTDGTLYVWYHHEVFDACGKGWDLVYPEIGAAVSRDNGHTFEDLGIVLKSGEPLDCEAKNGFFAGGHGDFTVVLDKDRKYFYFYYSAYDGPLGAQGVSVARMEFNERLAPVGQVWKYAGGEWNEPGLGGMGEPVFGAFANWASPNNDAFWGPSIHYNRHLNQWVMLLNRACCEPGWPQEGVYVSFNSDVADPKGWSTPRKILEGGGWYPMAVGLEKGDTEKTAAERARLFLGPESHYELVFTHNPPTGEAKVAAPSREGRFSKKRRN
jgi:hypothetical protein